MWQYLPDPVEPLNTLGIFLVPILLRGVRLRRLERCSAVGEERKLFDYCKMLLN